MSDFVQVPVAASQGIHSDVDRFRPVRHSVLIRLTHWVNTLSFVALLISGYAILLAQPGLYWGETGFFGDPSLINLPITQNEHQSGWGRSLHFLGAWVFVWNGGLYLISGLVSRHFREGLWPDRSQFSWRQVRENLWKQLRLKRPAEEEFQRYNFLQRLAYLGVIFILSPLVIVSGLAMSPAVVSVFPLLVRAFGGHQSARTIHFFVTCLLVLFLAVHLLMVSLPGFGRRMRQMIMGRVT